MPMFSPMSFVSGFCFFFFSFSLFVFQLVGWATWVGILWLAWYCWLGCVCVDVVASGDEVWIWGISMWMFDRDGDRMESDCRCRWYEGHVRALLCISFLRHQKPKQQKTVEKGKISVFSLEWNCCCGGFEWIKGGWWMMDDGTVINVERTSQTMVSFDGLSSVDGDKTISNNTQ